MMTLLPTPGYFVGIPTYLYGPVPSPGVPSTWFWDLLNPQTSAGQKTVTDSFFFAKTAQAGVAETLFRATVSDDADASYSLTNGTGGDGAFIPTHRYTGTTSTALSNTVQHIYKIGAGQDTGSVPVVGTYFQNSAGGQVGNRDLWQVINGATSVLSQNFRGQLTLTQLSFAGAQEMYFVINQVGLTNNGFFFGNSVSTDGELAPRLTFSATSTQASTLDALGATDSGTAPLLRYNALVAAGAVAVRPTHAWANNGTDQADLTAGGSLRIRLAGQGLCIAEGSNAKQGTATLVAGTVTVANTSITANSRIQLTGQDNSATGALRVSARVVGTSFTITSSDVGATGVVAYLITEPS